MELLTSKEVAAEFRVTDRAVRQWANAGEIPGAHKVHGQWRFDANKIRRWFRRLEKEPKRWGSIGEEKPGGYGSSLPGKPSAGRLEQLLGMKP